MSQSKPYNFDEIKNSIDEHKNPFGGFFHNMSSLTGDIKNAIYLASEWRGQPATELEQIRKKLWESYPEHHQEYEDRMRMLDKFERIRSMLEK